MYPIIILLKYILILNWYLLLQQFSVFYLCGLRCWNYICIYCGVMTIKTTRTKVFIWKKMKWCNFLHIKWYAYILLNLIIEVELSFQIRSTRCIRVRKNNSTVLHSRPKAIEFRRNMGAWGKTRYKRLRSTW